VGRQSPRVSRGKYNQLSDHVFCSPKDKYKGIVSRTVDSFQFRTYFRKVGSIRKAPLIRFLSAVRLGKSIPYRRPVWEKIKKRKGKYALRIVGPSPLIVRGFTEVTIRSGNSEGIDRCCCLSATSNHAECRRYCRADEELWSLTLLCRLLETAWVNLLSCLLCCGYATQGVKLSSAETKGVRRQRTALTGVNRGHSLEGFIARWRTTWGRCTWGSQEGHT
jgi:hypothetical protein